MKYFYINIRNRFCEFFLDRVGHSKDINRSLLVGLEAVALQNQENGINKDLNFK